jgi:hypothetical protein
VTGRDMLGIVLVQAGFVVIVLLIAGVLAVCPELDELVEHETSR